MKLGLFRKIPLLAMVVCISLAVFVTEVIASYELAHHDCIGMENGCTVCQRAKAAAEFLDTLRIACFFAFSSIFVLFIPETNIFPEEFIPVLSSPISLKDRSNT
jgi:hypothetical protein